MKHPQKLACPVCQSADHESFFELNCGNLDNSSLYPTVNLRYCRHCGHNFNNLTAEESAGLSHFYNGEYAPANLGIADKTADRPGSAGLLTTRRYEQMYQGLLPYINPGHSVLDVGCALGGFLDFLHSRGFSKLAGVDSTRTYVDQARQKNRYAIEIGSAESLPFNDRTFDAVVMEQVLEHLSNPVHAFQEARRVLKDGGIFCIGVPDAARYANCFFFDFYWLLLREHIQHFDIAHLSELARQTGFELSDYRETVHAIMTEQMLMPNLYAIFRRTDFIACRNQEVFDRFELKQKMDAYLATERARLSMKRRKIEELIHSRQPVYAWGIGREFLYLYEAAGLKKCSLAGLIDANPFKQSSYTVSVRKISRAEDLLPGAPPDSVLIITAVAHTDAIEKSAKVMDFKGRIMDLRETPVNE